MPGAFVTERAAIATAFVFVAAVMWPDPSTADGALAVGVPPDVAKHGFAYGYTTNKQSEEVRSVALENCRDNTAGSKEARPLCVVIETFSDECVAVAMDPVAGTPGVGWGVAADLRAAEAKALTECEATAGPGRRAACKIDRSSCDGSAK